MTRSCWMSCNFWSNVNAANSIAGKRKTKAGKTRRGSDADVRAARNRRLAHFLRSVLLSAIGGGGSRMAIAEVVTRDGTGPGCFALRLARSPVRLFRGHYIPFCRAVVSVAGTPFD